MSNVGASNVDTAQVADLMAITMARLIGNGEVVMVGVNSPLALVATLVARHLHAPEAIFLNIAGGVNANPSKLPSATTDPSLTEGSASVLGNEDFYGLVARGGIDVMFLGAVQIDRNANLNSSFTRRETGNLVRFPGGGGAAFILPLAKRTIVWRTSHSRRVFVNRCAFVTASGNVDRVVTPLCVFQKAGGRLLLESVHSHSSLEEVQAATEFRVEPSTNVPVTPAPSEDELRALDDVDPDRVRDAEFR